MGNIFSKPKEPDPPAVDDPEPMPDPSAETAAEAVKARRRSGAARHKTFLAGEEEPTEASLGKRFLGGGAANKKTLLGG